MGVAIHEGPVSGERLILRDLSGPRPLREGRVMTLLIYLPDDGFGCMYSLGGFARVGVRAIRRCSARFAAGFATRALSPRPACGLHCAGWHVVLPAGP